MKATKSKSFKQLKDALAPAVQVVNYYNEKSHELEMLHDFLEAQYVAQYEEGLLNKYEYNFYIKLNDKKYIKDQEKLNKECRKMLAEKRI